MRRDYASTGSYTFNGLGWPFAAAPEGGDTRLVEEMTLAGTVRGTGTGRASPPRRFLATLSSGKGISLAWLIAKRSARGLADRSLRPPDQAPLTRPRKGLGCWVIETG